MDEEQARALRDDLEKRYYLNCKGTIWEGMNFTVAILTLLFVKFANPMESRLEEERKYHLRYLFGNRIKDAIGHESEIYKVL